MSEIVVYHVGGGSDEIGPIESVRAAGFPLKVITFEALEGECVADRVGETDFYINKHPLSSGIYPSNPRYARETTSCMATTWGVNTEVDSVVRLKTTTIDILAAGKPQADVLSMDVQGAELRIMHGAENTLNDTLCVVSEVEFVPIYEGQPLFSDQMEYLTPYGFRLVELFNPQHWHPGPKMGLGFLTVAEAVFLRFDYETMPPERVERLAMLAAGFGRMSYARVLLDHLNGKVENEWLKQLWRFKDHPDLQGV